MVKGTIAVVKKGKNGIIRGDDGLDYRFNRKGIVQGSVDQIRKGRRVEFEPDGEWATQIHLLNEVMSTSAQKAKSSKSKGQRVVKSKRGGRPDHGYRFLNPYNFVRTLRVHDPSQSPLLGRVSPPPHDRYIGLSGRITCRLTVVTPLFVSDSHAVEPDQGNAEHYHYRFFRDPEGNIAIPATSLRGAIRNVFEAVTNSCFMHLSGENESGDTRLSYHLPPGEALKLVPGRVRKQGDEWQLELLPGTTVVTPDRRPSGPQYAAWVMFYRPILKSRTKVRVPHSPYSKRKLVPDRGYRHKESYWAIIEKVRHPLRHFEFWNVVAMAEEQDDLPNAQPGQQIVRGYLCINNQNIENKHDERFFFRDPKNTSFSQPLPLSDEVRRRYRELIMDYQERHSKEVESRQRRGEPLDEPVGKKPALSRFIADKKAKDLQDGDLVYAMLERRGMGVRVKFLVPVSVPRVGYENTVGSLLFPSDLRACDSIAELCPACRVFGWVHPNPPQDDGAIAVAYAGRVSFSHALRTKAVDGEFSVTLAILSTPKPTTSRFYLRPKHGKPQNGLPDKKVNYDAPDQVLRGRKFYRHHGEQLSEAEYKASADNGKGDQNRTVHDVQPPGTQFEFTVHFENLARLELGALLWSLEIEGWHHRIGYAKPLGFGSATVEVISLETMDWERRLSSLDETGWDNILAKKDELVLEFKQAMARRYGRQFEELDNVRDLKALLAASPPLPVHYPRPSKEPLPDGRNYEWFVGNKRSGRNAGPRLTLPLAEDDTEGLPLIDRFGNIVK